MTFSTKGLFTPWTVKLSQGLVKFVIGCCIHVETVLVYIKEKKNVKVILEFEISIRHILRPTLSTNMV